MGLFCLSAIQYYWRAGWRPCPPCAWRAPAGSCWLAQREATSISWDWMASVSRRRSSTRWVFYIRYSGNDSHGLLQDLLMRTVPDNYKLNPGAVEALLERPGHFKRFKEFSSMSNVGENLSGPLLKRALKAYVPHTFRHWRMAWVDARECEIRLQSDGQEDSQSHQPLPLPLQTQRQKGIAVIAVFFQIISTFTYTQGCKHTWIQ